MVERLIKQIPAPILNPEDGITKQEQQVLESYLFSNTPLPDLWRLFINCRDKKDAVVRRESTEFINSQSAQEYLEDRKRQWDALMMGEKSVDETVLDSQGEFTAESLRRIKMDAYSLALEGDKDALKTLTSFVLKQSKAQLEGVAPIRVLAERCSDGCHYKDFYEKLTPEIKTRGEAVVKYDRKTESVIIP